MQILIIATLIFLQTLTSCQQPTDNLATAEARLVSMPVDSVKLSVKNPKKSATNIVFKSTDGGQTWDDLSIGLPAEISVTDILINNDQIYLASDLGIFHGSASFMPQDWENNILTGERVFGFFPAKNGFYAHSHHKGFIQEVPGTGYWATKFGNMKDKIIHSVLETPEGTLFLSCDSGIFKSSDEGQSWKHVLAYGLIRNTVAVDDVLIASGLKGMFRSADGGEHWDLIRNDCDEAYKTVVVKGGIVAIAEGASQSTGYSLYEKNNRLIFSSDKGKTWERLDMSLLSGDIYDVVQAGDYLFCSHKFGISRSADQGKTWEIVRAPQNDRNMILLTASGDAVYAVMFSGC